MKTLRSFFTSQHWHYGLGFNSEIDFCFWALERDGLPVPPFDRHPEGDGSLRAAGLNAASWWAWLERAIAADEEWQDSLDALARQQEDAQIPHYSSSASAWNGNPAVGHRLLALYEEYEEIANERDAFKLAMVNLHTKFEAQLWNDLAPFRQTLPPVQIITVAYPGPVQAVIPPATILLAIGNWQPTPADLDSAILKGMETLAESVQP